MKRTQVDRRNEKLKLKRKAIVPIQDEKLTNVTGGCHTTGGHVDPYSVKSRYCTGGF